MEQLCFKGAVKTLPAAHDILMGFRSGLTCLGQQFLSFHNVFLFHSPKSSRKFHGVMPQSEPESGPRIGSQVCQLWAPSAVVSPLLLLSCCVDP